MTSACRILLRCIKSNKPVCVREVTSARQLRQPPYVSKQKVKTISSSQLNCRGLKKILWNHSLCSACDVLRRYRLISDESLTLLLEMGPDHPTQRVSFPGSLYKCMDNAKVEDQVRFLTLTLDHIIDLMDAKEQMSSVKWNPKTVDNFLNVLHRQSSDLKECVARYQKASHTFYERRIKRHFKILQKILKKNEYSAWAWEQIRRAVRSHLQRMDIMTSNAKTLKKHQTS